MGISKEFAQILLEENPDHPLPWRRKMQAIVDGALPNFYIESLTFKRDSYSNDLPSVNVHEIPRKEGERATRYKCQGNFIIGLTDTFHCMIEEEIVTDPQIIENIQAFLKSDLEFQIADPENVNRLARVNDVIDNLITYLESNYKLTKD